MKIGITGHSKGLGMSLYNTLSSNNHKVLGFSRSNGFDIKNPAQRKLIIDAMKDFDIFINLVHNYYHQSDLLFELHKEWNNQDKTIINISSAVVTNNNWAVDNYKMMEYKIQKINLETMAKHLNMINIFPKLVTYTITEIEVEHNTRNISKLINEKIHKE